MGKKSSPKVPKASDYMPLVEAQGNQNRVDTTTPYGSTTFDQLPDGRWGSNTGFSPGVQPIFEQQLAAALNPEAFNQTVSDASFNKAWGYLEPIQQQQMSQFEQSMADRGLPVGGEAYNDQYGNISRAQGFDREQAALAAILAGENSANNAFGRMSAVTGMNRQTPTAPVDVMGPASMAMNANAAQAAQNQGKKSSLVNAGTTLGAASLMGP
jgi:hypothetical protein